MLDDLADYSNNPVAFRDRIPYVLDLLAGAPSTPRAAAIGRPSSRRGGPTADRSAKQSIHEMRNAELKELRSLTAAQIHTVTGVSAADYPDMRVNDGDTITRVTWVFNGGASHGQPVLKTLRDYLQQVSELVGEAEERLGPWLTA
jgi:hypothetical protein